MSKTPTKSALYAAALAAATLLGGVAVKVTTATAQVSTAVAGWEIIATEPGGPCPWRAEVTICTSVVTEDGQASTRGCERISVALDGDLCNAAEKFKSALQGEWETKASERAAAKAGEVGAEK